MGGFSPRACLQRDLVEAGPTLAGAMLKRVGGSTGGISGAQAVGGCSEANGSHGNRCPCYAIELSITEVTRLDTDLRIIATPRV